MNRIALIAPLALVACAPEPVDVARDFYVHQCASCHGGDGRGNGPLASMLSRQPSDLTTIARRNGSFDRNAVMSTIDGYYRRDDPRHPMPEFGATIEGNLVMVENPDGTVTPTPEVLVGLADLLERMQR